MKKILIATLCLFLAIGGTQAQNMKTKQFKTNNNLRVKSDKTMSTCCAKKDAIALPHPIMGLDMPLGKVLVARQSIREFKPEMLSMEQLSSLLWCAYGLNRPDKKMRVVPSAINCQEYDIYLLNADGIYLYDAAKNNLTLALQGDHRKEVGKQDFVAEAPVVLLLVANYDRMTKFQNTEDRDFYAGIDCGYISQNIYLFCAANGMATVACGSVNRDNLQKALKISNGKIMLAHPVGIQ